MKPLSSKPIKSLLTSAVFVWLSQLSLYASDLQVSSIGTDRTLPKVLIMGDSISLGYTPHVKNLLHGKAEVIHHKGNACPTIRVLTGIDQWLGVSQWDLIHFNFGLWDMYGWEYVKEDRSPAMYEKKLEALVLRLEKNGRKFDLGNHHPGVSRA